MKKVALSLIALLAVGTFAFAEDTAAESAAAVSAKLSADAKAKFGVDLDTQKAGFKNEFNTDLELIFVPEADSSKTGTGDIYGSILIEDVSLVIDQEDKKVSAWNDADANDSDSKLFSIGDITAKINFPNGYVKIFENTNPKVGYAQDGDADNGGATIVADDAFYTYSSFDSTGKFVKYGATKTEWSFHGDPSILGFDAFSGTGIAIGYTLPSLVTLTTGLASTAGWDKGANDWEGSVEASLLAVEKLTLALKLYSGSTKNDKNEGVLQQGLGLKAAYDLGIIAPFFDLNTTGSYMVSAPVAAVTAKAYTTDPDTGAVTPGTKAVAAKNGVWDTDGAYTAELGVKLPLVDGFNAVVLGSTNSAGVIDAVATAALASGKLIGPVGAKAGVRLMNVTSDVKEDKNKTTEIFAHVTFDLGGGVGVWAKGSSYSSAAKDSSMVFVRAGVDAVNIFPLVTLGAEYNSNDLGVATKEYAKASPTVVSEDVAKQTAGQFFVYAKVAY